MIDQEISSRTQGMVQRRKAKVTTAPSLATNTIGVTEAFGDEMFLPFVSNMISAKVGDSVWIEWMYGATNAFVSSFAAVDDKNLTVAGTLDVVRRRCYAPLPSAGWYRILSNSGSINAGTAFSIDIDINTVWNNTPNVTRKIKLNAVNGKFVFSDETSLVYNTSYQDIDKIRCSQSSEKMYVDIHYLPNVSNYVSVDFSVHASPEMQGYIQAVNFVGVDPSPYLEDVLPEYTFASKAFSGIIVDERTVTTDSSGYYRFQDFPRTDYALLSSVPTVSGDYYVQITGSTNQWVRIMQANNSPLASTSVTLRTMLIHL